MKAKMPSKKKAAKKKPREWWLLIIPETHKLSQVISAYPTKAHAKGNAFDWHEIIHVKEVVK